MAVTTIKSTYALDVESVHTLERMAERWKVSKSEALRRAIRIAAADDAAPEALAALNALQDSLSITPARAKTWADQVRAERRAASSYAAKRGQ